MIGRVVGTVAALGGYWAAQAAYLPVATLVSGENAGNQFANSDEAYVKTMYMFSALSGIGGLFTLALLVVLALLWYSPVVKMIKEMKSE